MKKVFFVIAVFLVFITTQAAADDNRFVATSQEWGTFCEGKAESLSITVSNTCEKPYVLSICIKQKDGEWKCELTDGFEPGMEKTYGVCEATGEYKLAQCRKVRYCNAVEDEK